ncbi:citrate synthase [Bacillus cabrialesii]|uniref:citrate synthase n=1 Tax=Bacillus cabrialesii TaxID=2487276 RepID=UPI000E70EE89|nr:citrate synthase 3 [Bacillus subtilis]
MEEKQHYSPGLDGVIAAETHISYLDTQSSQILIRGYDLIDLSKTKSYLELAHLLLEGRLPEKSEMETLERSINSASSLPADILRLLELLPEHTHPMDSLRTGLSALAGYDRQIDDRSPSANKERAYQLLGKMPALTAASYRIINKKEPILPLQTLSYSANFLYMMTGKLPSSLEERIFDRSLVLYSEHEMPNSTFAARVIASTQSDLYGALTGAVASLKGNLHGGANEAVMYMLLEAETTSDFEQLLQTKLKRKEKIMGFGHRVYMKKMDPRALMMKEALQQLCDKAGDHRLYEMCEAGERLMEKEKGLYPNLDYYAAPVYWMLGIPIPLYTPVFFSARTSGLCAHVIEQHANNRLFRPRVSYLGPRQQAKS